MARRIDGLTDVDERPTNAPESKAQLAQRLEGLPREHPSSPGYRADGPRDSYWERTGEFERLWAEHEKRWPEPERADKSRPGDCHLSPEQNAEANREIAKLRAPEQSITATLQGMGGELAGLEHRIKGEDRLKDKIAGVMRKEPGSTVTDAVETVWDALRYTFRFDVDAYTREYGDITEKLSAAGCLMVRCENYWLANPEYKGVNTRWVTPEGSRFELQFHTAESLDAKEFRTHRAYERLRSPQTTWEERGALEAYQRLVSSAVPVPDDIAAIKDYQ